MSIEMVPKILTEIVAVNIGPNSCYDPRLPEEDLATFTLKFPKDNSIRGEHKDEPFYLRITLQKAATELFRVGDQICITIEKL